MILFISLMARPGSAGDTGLHPEPTSPTLALEAIIFPPSSEEVVDPPARLYQMKCAACHTVGGGPIGDSPDLNPSTAWPRADLVLAIDRMQKNVGPMTEAEIEELADLLHAPNVRERLAQERDRAILRRAATLDPGSPAIGRRLFEGRMALAHGGMPCLACHRAGGIGGTLAVDLTDAHERMGETGLTAGIQSAAFPVMMAAYRAHPVLEQEAIHLTAYLASLEGPPAAPARPERWGAGLALAALGGLGLAYRKRSPGVRARLVAQSRRSAS